jgi:hypothetical protein
LNCFVGLFLGFLGDQDFFDLHERVFFLRGHFFFSTEHDSDFSEQLVSDGSLHTSSHSLGSEGWHGSQGSGSGSSQDYFSTEHDFSDFSHTSGELGLWLASQLVSSMTITLGNFFFLGLQGFFIGVHDLELFLLLLREHLLLRNIIFGLSEQEETDSLSHSLLSSFEV